MKKRVSNLERIEHQKKWQESAFENKLNKRIATLDRMMNNTKWYKLFDALKNNNIMNIKIKFLLDDSNGIILNDLDIYEKGFEYYHKEGAKENEIFYGTSAYKEIEWIKIFENTEAENINKMGTKEIEKIINDIGKFEYQRDMDEIIIYGYK